jgi:hypothetical protein
MKWGIVAVVVGVGLMSISLKESRPPDVIKCGNEIMGPGDVCQETRRSRTTQRTYEEMKSSMEASSATFNAWGRWAYLGGGFVLAAGGVVGIVLTRRRRRRLAEAPQAPLPPNVLFVQRPYQEPQYQQVQHAPPPVPRAPGPHQPVPHQPMPRQYPPQQYPPPQQFGPPPQPYPPQGFGPTGPTGPTGSPDEPPR